MGDTVDPGAKERPARAAFTTWFAKSLVLDFPSHVAIVNESQLEGWGVSFEQAFSLGLDQLRRASAPRFEPVGPVFVGAWQDDYDSSRVLAPEVFRNLTLRGRPVVAIPNRLRLLVTGSEDIEGLRTLLAMAERIMREEPKPQNPAPLVLEGDAFVDFDVGRSSPVFNEVQRARRLAALSVYSEQKQLLDQLYPQHGKEILVAAYTLNQLPSGEYQSVCVWTKGVPALLPVTDEVVLVDPSQPETRRVVAKAPWTRVRELLGGMMEDTRMFPVRFNVATFPDETTVAALAEK